MAKTGKVKCDSKAAEMLFELHVEAFIEGLSDVEPSYQDYGLSHAHASEIVGRVLLGADINTQHVQSVN